MKNNYPKISGWTKSSFIDYPGHPSALLFLPNCNLRCPYCHNPGVVSDLYPPVPFDAVSAHIAKRKGVIEGVVISGGEPTLHPGLADLCGDLQSIGLKVKIDTNGLEPEALAACSPDYLAVDVKATTGKYRLLNAPYAAADIRERLCKSVNIVKSMGKNAEIRITAVPGIIDSDDIECLCGELGLRGVSRVFIQRFNPSRPMLDPAYSSIAPYGAEELESMRFMFLEYGIECAIRG